MWLCYQIGLNRVFFQISTVQLIIFLKKEQSPILSSLADGIIVIVLILVKTGWEGKGTEWGGWLTVCWIISSCAASSSVHKMAVEHRCYGNAPFKLPLHPQSPQAISIISPPHITPFPSGSADSVISVCHVGQWRSAAGALRCTDWQSRVLGREVEEGGSNVEVGTLMSWCWGQTACGRCLMEILSCA